LVQHRILVVRCNVSQTKAKKRGREVVLGG
jgi:hypothetical protein